MSFEFVAHHFFPTYLRAPRGAYFLPPRSALLPRSAKRPRHRYARSRTARRRAARPQGRAGAALHHLHTAPPRRRHRAAARWRRRGRGNAGGRAAAVFSPLQLLPPTGGRVAAASSRPRAQHHRHADCCRRSSCPGVGYAGMTPASSWARPAALVGATRRFPGPRRTRCGRRKSWWGSALRATGVFLAPRRRREGVLVRRFSPR